MASWEQVSLPKGNSATSQVLSEEERQHKRQLLLAKRQREGRDRVRDIRSAGDGTSLDGGDGLVILDAAPPPSVPTPSDMPVAIPTAEDAVDISDAIGATESSHVLVAHARVYAGTLRRGDAIWIFGAKYDPNDPTHEHATKVTVSKLYALMGRDLVDIEEAPAGVGDVCARAMW